jgi:hypothetical protein
MPDNYHEFNIYFSDLNEDAQERLLKAVGAKTASEANWDMDIVPIATYCFFNEGEKSSEPD